MGGINNFFAFEKPKSECTFSDYLPMMSQSNPLTRNARNRQPTTGPVPINLEALERAQANVNRPLPRPLEVLVKLKKVHPKRKVGKQCYFMIA